MRICFRFEKKQREVLKIENDARNEFLCLGNRAYEERTSTNLSRRTSERLAILLQGDSLFFHIHGAQRAFATVNLQQTMRVKKDDVVLWGIDFFILLKIEPEERRVKILFVLWWTSTLSSPRIQPSKSIVVGIKGSSWLRKRPWSYEIHKAG